MFWSEIWKISYFLPENFQFLEVNFSIYLIRRVFVMAHSDEVQCLRTTALSGPHFTIIPFRLSVYLSDIWIKNYSRYLVHIIHNDRGHWKEMHCLVLLTTTPRFLLYYTNQFTVTAVTLPCIHTEMLHISFADLFSAGICLCTLIGEVEEVGWGGGGHVHMSWFYRFKQSFRTMFAFLC